MHTRGRVYIYRLCKQYCVTLTFSYLFFPTGIMFLRSVRGAACTCDPLLHNNSEGQPRALLRLLTNLQQASLWISHCAHMLECLWI